MLEPIRFHVDPVCPWCYQTARWARRLEALGEVVIDWTPFSLAIVNKSDEARAASTSGSAAALRTLIQAREERNSAAAGGVYFAIAGGIHERGLALDDGAVIADALRQAGLDDGLVQRALDDPGTWREVQREHDAAVAEHKVFGVPAILLDGGAGPAIFGPIIREVPDDTEAVELWHHVSWLVRNQNFAELKRERSGSPDLESVRQARERRAKTAAQDAAERRVA